MHSSCTQNHDSCFSSSSGDDSHHLHHSCCANISVSKHTHKKTCFEKKHEEASSTLLYICFCASFSRLLHEEELDHSRRVILCSGSSWREGDSQVTQDPGVFRLILYRVASSRLYASSNSLSSNAKLKRICPPASCASPRTPSTNPADMPDISASTTC